MRQKQGVFSLFLLSPSSRRAWIEIENPQYEKAKGKVALLAEGVDRNCYVVARVPGMPGRPPRGGRG